MHIFQEINNKQYKIIHVDIRSIERNTMKVTYTNTSYSCCYNNKIIKYKYNLAKYTFENFLKMNLLQFLKYFLI